jgi:hypothetical protein
MPPPVPQKCRADVDRLLGGRCLGGFLAAPFVGGLAAEAAMGAMVVVEVLPFLELVVEQLGVVDDDALELPVELLAVDPVGSLDLAVQLRRGGLDVDVPDAAVGQVPVESGLELRTVVRLDLLDPERQLAGRKSANWIAVFWFSWS